MERLPYSSRRARGLRSPEAGLGGWARRHYLDTHGGMENVRASRAFVDRIHCGAAREVPGGEWSATRGERRGGSPSSVKIDGSTRHDERRAADRAAGVHPAPGTTARRPLDALPGPGGATSARRFAFTTGRRGIDALVAALQAGERCSGLMDESTRSNLEH